ncbi:hypothetical protein G9A89_020157 [Geosiphon pyriformis]|nr:hypothetical protein G9A89_020157 [Geosiphon pyriformis]
MKPAGSSAGGSGFGSTGLGSQSDNKKKAQVESVYSRSPSYKKAKKSGVAVSIVDLLAGSLPAVLLHSGVDNRKVFWGSEVKNEESSISKVLNIENLKNIVAEEMSYVNFNASETDNMVNNTTPKKMQTRSYILGQPPKMSSLYSLSDNNTELVLPVPKSSFTSEKSLIKAKEMAVSEKILVNNNVKKANSHSDWEVIIKEISVDLPRSAVESVFSKFGKIVSIKMQLIGLWQKALVEFKSSEVASLVASKWSVLMKKNLVCVALAIGNKQTWVSRDQHQTLLYTLPVGTTAYDLSGLLDSYGGKTCLAAISSVPIFKGVSLYWAGLSLICCATCKHFSHVSDMCSADGNSRRHDRHVVTLQDQAHLADIYKKRWAPIACPVSFGGKTWAQVAGRSFSHVVPLVVSGVKSSPNVKILSMNSNFFVVAGLNDHLAFLECSLELLADQVSGILKRLGFVELVSLPFASLASSPVISAPLDLSADLNMSIDNTASDFGSSNSKILITKVGGLESKMMALDVVIGSFVLWVGFVVCPFISINGLVWKIATCNVKGMNNSTKQDDIIYWHNNMNNLISIFTETKLKGRVRSWIINKFDGIRVFTSGLNSGYLGANVVIVVNSSLARHVYKVSEVPGWLLSIKLLFKNKLLVSILGLYAGASSVVRFSQAGEVNSFITKAVNESSFIILGSDFNEDGLCKSTSFRKCLNLELVNSLSGSLVAKSPTWENSRSVKKTIDYVFVFPSLVSAIVYRNVLGVGKHYNMNHQAVSVSISLGGLLDNNFKGATLANAIMFSDEFVTSARFLNLDAMWSVVRKIMVLSANEVFKKKWFKGFNNVFTKKSSRFHKLKLLVSKIVKALHEECIFLDNNRASVVQSVIDFGADTDGVCSALFSAKKFYCASKLAKSLRVKKANIRSVVLNHLVMGDELVLEPDLVKSKTRKHVVVNDAFSGVMCAIDFDELHYVVSDLPDGKATSLLGISNELWKHCDELVLGLLLVLLNFCLSCESGVFTNTHPIALIKTACKILSKILLDRILLACSSYNVLRGNNFSVLKGMMTQSPIFAIGLVIKNALEKNRELCLVLQDMQKAYNLVGWEHFEKSLVKIKMCSKFIRFFGSIHKNYTNRVITDFSLINGYHVHDGLNQKEESMCKYRLISYFVSKSGHTESQVGLSFFFAAGAFHIFNVTSEFFQINDISINNDKTVVILINSKVSNLFLSISGSPIFIAKKGKSHQYLGIFFSTEGLLKSSLAKVNSDVHFSTNLVLRKAVLNKQFLYLVSAVLHSIISYRMQFSFDVLIHKGLKLKFGLLLDFSSDTIHHPSFYGLKSFSQCQSKSKIALLISFANSSGILGCLFSHRSHDLQVLYWQLIHPLISPIHIRVSVSNNFLAGMVSILLDCKLPLGGSLASAFQFRSGVLMSIILGEFLFFKFLPSLWRYGIAFVDQLQDHHSNKRLDSYGPVPEWFVHSVKFLGASHSSPSVLVGVSPVNICGSDDFVSVCDHLSRVGANSLSVYTDGSLKNLGMTGCRTGAADLVSSTLAELQAVVLALECILVARSVYLFSDSQVALDACMSEVDLVYPDFHNQCWIERWHIRNVIYSKNLRVSWHKVKGHSGVSGNNQANSIADATTLSDWFLPPCVDEHFLLVDNGIVSDVFHAVCQAHWEVSFSSGFLLEELHLDVNWPSFTNRHTANTHTYLMKALHCQLPMAVRKHIYNRCYSSVLCLYCGEIEVSDHVFSCVIDDSAHRRVLESCMSSWKMLSGLFFSTSSVLQLLSTCASNFLISSAFYKSFAVFIFHNPKVAGIKIANFMCSFCVTFRNDIWLVCAKHHVYIEKNSLILVDSSIPILVFGLVLRFSDGMVKLLGIAEAFGVCFGFCKSCSFFSGIGNPVSVNIIV